MAMNHEFIVGEARGLIGSARNIHPHATTQLTRELGTIAGLGLRALGHYNQRRLPKANKYTGRVIDGMSDHKLTFDDYVSIADESGRLPTKGEYALTPQVLELYEAEAQLVYNAGRSVVHPAALDYWKALRQNIETARAQEVEAVPSLCTLPHIFALTSRYAEYVGQKYPHNYRLNRSIEVFHTSPKDMHLRLIDLSNDMYDANSSLLQRAGQDVNLLRPYAYNTNQAVSRIYAVPYLMAADVSDPDDAALFTEVSQVTWQMTRMAGDTFSDPMGNDNVELLGGQWEFGLDTNLMELENHSFRMYYANQLTAQVNRYDKLA